MGDVGAGHVLGRYELLLPLASGGMAMVWAARLKGTRGFQKIVAVKTMLPKMSEDPDFEQMFLDEAALASQVRHPHVVEILDLGEHDGVLFLVMEWIDGVPLNQLMKVARKSGGIPLPISVRIVSQALAGLHAAHELKDSKGQLVGLVHRDISPQNILVTYDGVAKVVDFGVAKATALGDGATKDGQIKGKVAYMSPEQIKGVEVDRRMDVFAMGIILYALTTGRHPFRKDSEAATLYNIVAPEPAKPPRALVPGYPPALERVVMQAIAKDAAKRFPTASDMLRALDQSLPNSMRISTDDDVSAFLRSLFAERREQQRVALDAALVRADTIAKSSVSLKQLLDSQPPPPPESSISGVSDRSVLEITDVSAGNSHPGAPASTSGLELGEPLPVLPGSKGSGRGRWLAALVALGLLLGVGVMLLLRSRAVPVDSTPSGSAPVAARPVTEPGQPAAEPEASAAAAPVASTVAPVADSAPSAAPETPPPTVKRTAKVPYVAPRKESEAKSPEDRRQLAAGPGILNLRSGRPATCRPGSAAPTA